VVPSEDPPAGIEPAGGRLAKHGSKGEPKMHMRNRDKNHFGRPTTAMAMLAVPAVAFALLAGGCGSSDSSSSSTTAETSAASTTAATSSSSGGTTASTGSGPVEIVDFKYDPETVTVKAGSKLEFTNKDSAAHTATAQDSSFDTGTLNQGDSATVTLDKPGTYDYYCRFHAFMKASVVVK
jgi:plastocyanin